MKSATSSLLIRCLIAASAPAMIAVAGCTSPHTSDTSTTATASIPDDANVVDQGTGRIAYAARSDGRIYLYDLDDRTLVDSRALARGQQYVAMPDQNRAQVDGRTVFERDLKRNHVYRLYYAPSHHADWSHDDWRAMSLPQDAREVEGGRGQVTWRADRDGRIWVYDAEDQKVVFGRRVHRGDELLITPSKDRIDINGKNMYEGNLVHDHTHRIYFDRD